MDRRCTSELKHRVEIVTHIVHELDPDGKQLRVVKFTDYTAEKVRTLYRSASELRTGWADPEQRAEIIQKLAERGIDFDELAKAAGQPDSDPFDLLCHVAFNAPLRTRRERADRLRREEKDFFDHQYGPQAKEILGELLEKYAEYGTAQFVIPDVLKVPPISERGNVMEIAGFFGGPEQLRTAVHRLQTLRKLHLDAPPGRAGFFNFLAAASTKMAWTVLGLRASSDHSFTVGVLRAQEDRPSHLSTIFLDPPTLSV